MKIDGITSKHGFYTARFIEAQNPSTAEELAMDLVRTELKMRVLNDESDPPMIKVFETYELDSFEDHLVPGKGFTWYEEE